MLLNYHTDLVIKMDIILLAAYLIFAIALVLYVILRDHGSKRHMRKLLGLKENLARLFLSGEKTEAAAKFVAKVTPEEFVDVQTNRRKYAVFFNELEQQLLKELYVTTGKIKDLKSLLKRPIGKWHKIETITALGYTQADEAPDILEASLYSKNGDISYFSALAIGQVSTVHSVSILMRFLKKAPTMRRKTASILENLSPDITNEVIKYVDDKDPEVRTWAVRLLAKSASTDYIKKVEELTKDPSPEVRASACVSLAKLNDKDSKQMLLTCLKDDAWFVRMHAVRALSKIFGKDALPEIMSSLNDGSLLVIDSVKQAMVNNIEAAMPYIKNILEGTDELAKKMCKEAMDIADLKK